ncbi:MAG: hypothetical protein EAZ53_17160 [Bacteroidetes bacterium]|nr:MAG: hypothetical protein EAZ53_17160 [Bacteroidota bacterium]
MGSWVGKEFARAVAHGVAQSYIYVFSSAIKGEDVSLSNFAITFATAGIASAASSGLKLVGAAVSTNAVNQFANSLGGQMAFGGIIGGLTESAMGGNFFHGFATGAIVSGLNHGMHDLADGPPSKDPTLDDAIDNYKKGGGDMEVDASKVDLHDVYKGLQYLA